MLPQLSQLVVNRTQDSLTSRHPAAWHIPAKLYPFTTRGRVVLSSLTAFLTAVDWCTAHPTADIQNSTSGTTKTGGKGMKSPSTTIMWDRMYPVSAVSLTTASTKHAALQQQCRLQLFTTTQSITCRLRSPAPGLLCLCCHACQDLLCRTAPRQSSQLVGCC